MNADSGFLQTLLEILHGLCGLTSDSARNQDAIFDTELTRHNHPVASANDRGIRTKGFGSGSLCHVTNVSCQNRQLTHRPLASYSHNSLTEDLKGIRMAIDESKRQDLYLVATEKFGRKEADTLMTLLPTSVWEDVATKTDLELHDALLKLQINEVHNDLKTEIADLRAELKGDIADVRLEIAELRTEMHQMFRKNYMVMISAIFAINSLFFAATKYWG